MNLYSYSVAGAVLALCLTGCSTDQSVVSSGPRPDLPPLEMAYPNQTGQLRSGTYLGNPITYRYVNGEAVFQGDMILPASELTDADRATEGTGRTLKSLRWTGRIVHYTIDPTLPDQQRVRDAIAHWEANTPIRFVARTSQYSYVTFRPGGGCSSNVGRVGGQQFVTLSDWCTTGNTIHEVGHAVGLYHEHNRADRDNFVTVLPQNITPGSESEFKTYVQLNRDGFDHVGGFDFNSVMFYHSWAFSSNGQPTLTKKDGSTIMAQRDGLSPLDIATVQSMYP